MSKNFDHMLRQLDKGDLIPPPLLLKPNSMDVPTKNLSNLVVTKQISNDKSPVESGNARQWKRQIRKSTTSKDEFGKNVTYQNKETAITSVMQNGFVKPPLSQINLSNEDDHEVAKVLQ